MRGELPLAECTCDAHRSARAEKDHIRDDRREGMGIDQVVNLVRETYGRMTS
ncbi:MAG: hypothetical protein AB1427_17455 [Thermodesulfobacteriota bacterium]